MRTRVKICGITRLDDALAAVAAGADALGFVFYRRSPRFIEPDAARDIIAQLPPFIETVGLFVNEELQTINRLADDGSFSLVQLHGDEDPDFAAGVRCRHIKALRLETADDLANCSHFPRAAGLLIDACVAGAYGGTGQKANWDLARQAVALKRPILLAGGLNPNNVSDAITAVQPYAVDVSSGVESAPGRKDHTLITAFLRAVKDTDHETT